MTLVEALKEEYKESKYTPDNDYYNGYSDGLRYAIAVARTHNNWVPADQPPKHSCDCMITVERRNPLTKKRYRKTMQSHYEVNGNYFYSADNLTVIAWQPLPKPCEGE